MFFFLNMHHSKWKLLNETNPNENKIKLTQYYLMKPCKEFGKY